MLSITPRPAQGRHFVLCACIMMATSGALAQEISRDSTTPIEAPTIAPQRRNVMTDAYLESRLDAQRGVPPVLIVDQFSPSSFAGIVPSTVHPDDPPSDVLVFDEFTVTSQVVLDQLVVYGIDEGNPACNLNVVGQVWQGRPGDGGTPIITASGVQLGQDLIITFAGDSLPPGTYLINVHVIRNALGPCVGQNWHAILTSNISEREAGIWQPNGTSPVQKISDTVQPDGPPVDLQFQLSGFLFSGQDCNANGEDDAIDIYLGESFDTDKNGIPDECQRDGLVGLPDFDLDAIPDLDDPDPTVHAPDPAAPTAQIQIEQLSLAGTEMFLPDPLTEHGAITLTFPTVPDVYLYVNIEVNGIWAVQNQVVVTTENPYEAPIQSETFYIDLGVPRGTPVPDASVRWWIDPIGLVLPPPGTGPIIPVTEARFSVGGGGPPAPDPRPIGAADNVADPAPMPMVTKEVVENNGIRVADMKHWYTGNSCGPNSVAGSFEWLIKEYMLMLPASVDSHDELLAEFRRTMGTLNNNWTTDVIMKRVKEGFIRKHMLPLTVESGNVGGSSLGEIVDGLVTPQQLFDEMKKGQDVEILMGWWDQSGPGGTWKRNGGHFVAIKKIVKCVKDGVTTWKITLVHDSNQVACEGVKCVTVTATQEDIDLDNGGVTEPAWVLENGPLDAAGFKPVLQSYVAESPTISQLNKVIAALLADYSAARTAALADGDYDILELIDLYVRVDRIKKMWMRLLATAEAAMPPNQSIINSSKRAIQSICTLRDIFARRIREALGFARSVLPENDNAAIAYESDSVTLFDYPAIVATSPPDADFDGIEDGLDNAPFVANPDQADQDLNGTPDVLELSAITDCDDNGVIDDFQVTEFAVVAENPDGTMVAGFPFDLDTNGIPDPCEAPIPNECTADLDGDGFVTVFDFAIFAANFGQPVILGTNGDFDNDGFVTVFDFAIFAADFACSP